MMARMYPPTFGLEAAVAGGDLPEEWQTLIASQVSMLTALLSRMQTAVATLRQRQAPAAQVQALATEAERVLTAQAQQQVSLERELVALRALVMDFGASPSGLAARVRTLESALAVLHANLATARRYLATLFPQEP